MCGPEEGALHVASFFFFFSAVDRSVGTRDLLFGVHEYFAAVRGETQRFRNRLI